MKERGFTILELIVVLVVIGILSTLAVSYYRSYKERVLDKQVDAALRLIQQGQKVYYMEKGSYYPTGGSTSETNINLINGNLSILLDEQSWDYTVYSGGAFAPGTATATPALLSARQRTWVLGIDDKEPVCTGNCLKH